jgi:hypothetical protein
MHQGVEHQSRFQLSQASLPIQQGFLRDIKSANRGVETHAFTSGFEDEDNATQGGS